MRGKWEGGGGGGWGGKKTNNAINGQTRTSENVVSDVNAYYAYFNTVTYPFHEKRTSLYHSDHIHVFLVHLLGLQGKQTVVY